MKSCQVCSINFVHCFLIVKSPLFSSSEARSISCFIAPSSSICPRIRPVELHTDAFIPPSLCFIQVTDDYAPTQNYDSRGFISPFLTHFRALTFKTHILLTFLSFLFVAYFFVGFITSYAYRLILSICSFMKHCTWLSTFIFQNSTFQTFIFRGDTFPWEISRYQHIELSFIRVNYKVAGIFYAFFPWLTDDLIFAFHNCDISQSIIWFELHNFHNCITVSHNL